MSIPVIVDCDPGHDDVFALWLAAGHPSLELLAVTTVGDGPLHDPVAVAVLADPDCVELAHTRLDVELAGIETAGATSVDLGGMLRREPNAWVATGLDVDRFWGLVERAISRLA